MAKKAAEPVEVSDELVSVIELDANLADVEAPPLLPAGRYRAEVRSVAEAQSQKGNTYYSQLLVVSPDEFPHDFPSDVYPDGLTLYYNMIVKPKNQRQMHNLKLWMQKLGLDVNTTRIDPNEWVGREVAINIKHGSYQGNPREEIVSVEALD